MSNFEFLYVNVCLSRFQVRLVSDESLPSDFYLGSTLRGAIGWQMQRLVCPFDGRKKCDACLVRDDCPYHELYCKQSALPGLADSPRGYVYYVSPDSGSNFVNLEITLFGSCSRFAPVLFEALLRASKSGLTRRRIAVGIEKIEQIIPDGKKRIYNWKQLSSQIMDALPLVEWLGEINGKIEAVFSIKTPLRLRKNGRYLNYLDMDFLLQNILRRMESLGCVFGDGESIGKENWERIKEEMLPDQIKQCESPEEMNGTGLSYHARIRWDDYKRYSNTQRKKVPMGGIVGDVRVKGADKNIFPLLRAVEFLHVGKGAAMGLGRVEMLN